MDAIKYLLFFCWATMAASLSYGADIQYGLVKEGAFLLSAKPDTPRDGLLVHSLIGYLPTGTRVQIQDKYEVTNLSSSNHEAYFYVNSELGFQGLIREDLLLPANGRRLAVSVASYPIPIHRANATLHNSKIQLTLGRYGGNYLEITGETEPGFYDVVLHRANVGKTHLPKQEKARLKKLYVEKNQVSLLDPNDQSLQQELTLTWSSVANIDNALFSELITKVEEAIGDDADTIKAMVSDVNDLQCLIGGSANGELGFKIFSNGFSLKLDASLKQKGVKYIFEGQKLFSGDQTKYYSGVGIVQCDGIRPVRMQSFTIQEDLYSRDKRFSISLKDLERSTSKWISTLQGSNISNKMVRIRGWNDYNQLIKELNGYAVVGDGYLSTLPEKTRLLLLNYIVSRIGFFEHRDIII